MKIVDFILKKVKLSQFRKEWRQLNPHNNTYAINIFPLDKVKVGRATYGALNINSYGYNNCNLSIGSYCSIAGNAKILLGGEHSYKFLSTYPFKHSIFHEQSDTFNKGDIIIGDDVWIGEDCLILSGVTIGQGALIGAGAVVAKDIPPYAIAVGNPARVVKYRCSEEKIKLLLELDFSKLNESTIKEHINELYADIENIDIAWFPQK